MNKTELIAAAAAEANVSKKDAAAVIDAAIAAITAAMKKEEKVQLIGFGTFETRARAARQGKNPKTGEAIKIAATKVPAFKAGAALKNAVK
ncbi:MAG: HU family DNA-binding protein [Ruminococcaceae bacterium]|nr:HU family DNA-binding protein [Oscillospiraceae bacterium]